MEHGGGIGGRVEVSGPKLGWRDQTMSIHVRSQPGCNNLLQDLADTFKEGDGVVRVGERVVSFPRLRDDYDFSCGPRVSPQVERSSEEGGEEVGVCLVQPTD
jgi:hypothetical protein